SCDSVWSTIAAGTISQTARGLSSLWTRSSSDLAPTAPSFTRAWMASGCTSYTTHLCPARITRRTMFAPIRPSPIMPSCIDASPLDAVSPPVGTPETPVHGGIGVQLRGHQLLLCDLLLLGEHAIALVGGLVADVEALAPLRIGEHVQQLAVGRPGVRDQLERRQRLQMRDPVRSVGRLHLESRGRQEILLVLRALLPHGGAAAERHDQRDGHDGPRHLPHAGTLRW